MLAPFLYLICLPYAPEATLFTMTVCTGRPKGMTHSDWSYSWRPYLSFSSCCCCSDKSNFRKDGSILANTMVKSRQKEPEDAVECIRKCWLLPASHFPFSTYIVQGPSEGVLRPIVRSSSSRLSKTIKIISQSHAQNSISQLILGSSKLTVNTSHHVAHSGSHCGEKSSS